ncbi:MAG: Gfo/Idh/MocA family oxidoreductase [Bacteroidota bacterium]
MKTLSFSVIGLGRIGQRHAKIISEFEGTELVSVVDVDSSTFQSLESLQIDAGTFHSINEFLEQDQGKTDVVTIATPNGFHTAYAVQCLEAGYHVVIEKPMGLNVEECEAVIEAELRSGKRVFVVKQNRYSPPSIWLKKIVSEKIIGVVLMVQTNCYWNRDSRYYAPSLWKGKRELDGGALFTQFSHFIDIMFWVFGDIINPKSIIRNFTHSELKEFDDSGFAQFEFENGGIGSVNYSTSCWDKNMESSITVVGTKGSVKVGGQYMNEIEYCHIENYDMPELAPTNPPNDYGPYKGSAANHHYVIENVIETLIEGRKPTATSLDGLKVVGIIEKIYKAGGFM